MKRKMIIFITAVLLLFGGTAMASDALEIDAVHINFYDENMLLIDEASIDGFEGNQADYIFPLAAEYIDITVNRLNKDDWVVIKLDGNIIQDMPYSELDGDDHLVEIALLDSSDNEQKYTINLTRNAFPRENALEQISWKMRDIDGNEYYPGSIKMQEDVTLVEVPYSVDQITLDTFVLKSDYCDVKVTGDNNNVLWGNIDEVIIDIDKEAVSVSIETYIDDTTNAYILTFQKSSEPSDNNDLEYILVTFFGDGEDLLESVIETGENQYEYSLTAPPEYNGFEVYAQPQHIMAKANYTCGQVETDGAGDEYYSLEDDNNAAVEVAAENGDTKTYTISITKEADTEEALAPAETAENTGGGFPYWILIVIGGVIAAAAVVLIIIRNKSKKS